MSLLTTVQSVCRLIRQPVPTTVSASTDGQVLQMWELLNEEVADLSSFHPWQALTTEYSITTLNQEAQPTGVPADLDRWVPDSFYNRTTRRALTGPVPPQQWQSIKAYPYLSTVYLMWRERQGVFYITPAPPAGQSIYGEYISNAPIRSFGGAAQTTYQNDSDTSVLSEQLMGLGLRWRFLKAKGLEYGEDKASYESNREQVVSRDGGSRALSISPMPFNLRGVNIPDGNFGF